MKTMWTKILALMLGMVLLLGLMPGAAAEASATLTIRVYEDRDGNGERGAYDGGVAGITVHVLPAGSEEPVATLVTDEEGILTLNDLPEGDYCLKVEVQEGMGFSKTGKKARPSASNVMDFSTELVQTSPVFHVATGEETVVAVGVAMLSAVSGKAWNDVNGDGIMQEDEPGQEDVFISLAGVHNGLVYEFTTGEDGLFYIGQVKPGNYKMTVTTPEGTMFTRYSKTGGSMRSYYTTEGRRTDSRAFELKAGQVFDERYIGVLGDGTIEVLCYLDANFNGFFDQGEDVLPGVEVDVLKANGKTVNSAVTGQDGVARINALRTAEYGVHALLPKGYTYTRVVEGGNQFDSRNGRREYTIKGVSVDIGASTRVQIGAVMPGTISGVAYLDDNFSGHKDDKEKIVSGLIIALLDENGEQVDVKRTTAKGTFLFEGVNPGTYTMRMEAKRGYAFTKLGEGNVFVNIGDGRGQTEPFTVALGEELTGMDIGQILPGTVQGTLFADANDNGLQDNGETGFAGAVVHLMDEAGEQFVAAIGEDGLFCFDAVMPGRYYLIYELPENSAFSPVVSGGNAISGETNVACGEWFDFTVGATVNAKLCGGLKLGAVSGMAFADHNGSGLQEQGEEALAGVTITLTPQRTDLQPVIVETGSNGAFSVDGLHPDTYTLTLECPEGYVLSRTDGMTLPVEPGLSAQEQLLQVAMGSQWQDQPLGCVKPASLRGMAWLDENCNGLFEDEESRPAGQVVTVIDQYNGQVFADLTIAEDGSFAIDGLIPGSYTLQHGPAIQGTAGDSTFVYEDGMMVMRDVAAYEDTAVEDVLLGIVRHTAIGGRVWADMGGEICDLPGAALTLSDENGSILAQTQSDEQGAYRFDGLMPGAYVVSVTVPEGQVVVEPQDERVVSGQWHSVMASCRGREGKTDVIDLKMGRDRTDLDIGSVLPGSLGDVCWLDLNANGLQDTDEGGIPGLTIQLLRNGEVTAETVSDQYGFYAFRNVYPATYTLRVIMPEEITPTQLRTDVPMIASVLEEGGESVSVQVISNRFNRHADLGFVPVNPGEYPQGYGEGATQDWTRLGDKD